MSRKTFVPTKNVLTWDTISNRLGEFTPEIALADYIDVEADNAVTVHDYTSVGIDFVLPKYNRDKFLELLRRATTRSGKQAFEEGRWQGALHAGKGALRDLASGITGNVSYDNWALNISFKSTKGIGFRQIWYLELSELTGSW